MDKASFTMKVQFFGRIGDRIGREVGLDLPPDGCSVADLRSRLALLHPHAKADLMSPSLRACVDETIATEDQIVSEGETVAFFPPLSGG
jgi:sulfur-carrier protein